MVVGSVSAAMAALAAASIALTTSSFDDDDDDIRQVGSTGAGALAAERLLAIQGFLLVKFGKERKASALVL